MYSAYLSRMVLALSLVIGPACVARADVIRFHYAPVGNNGQTVLQPAPDGAAGEWKAWAYGVRTLGWYCAPKATHIMTYRHPLSCRNVTVPVAFPQGTPQITYTADSINYAYTIYIVRIEFLPDGSVDVVYNSGVFRSL